MVTPLLSVSNLNIAFQAATETGWRSVVNDLSFTIGKGKTLALVGESGSGKSVSALSIMRLLDRKVSRMTGSIAFEGVDLLRVPEEDMFRIRGNRISMIFQEPMTSLNPVYPVGVQVDEVLTRHQGLSAAAARAETIRLFERVRIPAAGRRVNEYPHQFSGGMRQRVLIAMALACNPDLLIADEPTTALDVTIQAQIIALIKELQQERAMSVLFITHDMGVVAEVADDTVVMYKGDQVESGPTADLFSRQTHPYTRALLAAVPRLGSMAGIPNPRKFAIIDKVTGETEGEQELPSSVVEAETPLVQVKGLTKRFDIQSGPFGRVHARIHAVEDVSFDVRAGETLALVGESGCGKSTTGRTLVQLQKATSGSVLFNGADISSLSNPAMRSLRRDIQMIFQDPFASLNPTMNIGDAIAEPMLYHGLATRADVKDRVRALMEVVGLNPDFGLPPEKWSSVRYGF